MGSVEGRIVVALVADAAGAAEVLLASRRFASKASNKRSA